MKSPVDKSQRDHYMDIFRAMSDPIRMRIVSMIADTDELGCTVLEETLPISKSTISYHIKILGRAGLIDVRKEGRYYFYRLRRHVFDFYLPAYLERIERERERGGLGELTTRAGSPVGGRAVATR